MGDTYAAVIFSDRDAHADSTKTQATAPAIFFLDIEDATAALRPITS